MKEDLHTYEELHLWDLLVYFLHEFNHEIDKLVRQHLFGVEVGDEEGDVEAFNWLPAQNEEWLCSLGEESSEFVDKNVLDLIGLLDANGYSNGISGRLNEAGVSLVNCDKWVQMDTYTFSFSFLLMCSLKIHQC